MNRASDSFSMTGMLLAFAMSMPFLAAASVQAMDEEVDGTQVDISESAQEQADEDAALKERRQRNAFPLPPNDVDVVGEIQIVEARDEDTLLDIGRRYGIGFEAMRMANPGVDIWIPGEGTEVVIPSRYILPPGPRKGLVINLPEMRMYYYPEPKPGERPVVETYAISVGRLDWSTPIGTTRVTGHVKDPAWYPPASVRERHANEGRSLPRRVDPGPDNPLGRHAIGLDIPSYFIHGTNRPAGVGMRVTHGCIRMFPEDIEYIFNRLPRGTEVRIMNEPYKVGWASGQLFVQAFPPMEEDDLDEARSYNKAVQEVVKVLDQHPAGRVDRDQLRAAIQTSNGLPVAILEEPGRDTRDVARGQESPSLW
ncbi:L,D-transpeptidase family protein [Methylonatrum kenyense]|uniref:L,D-transpeptidase family protein n=1 Tax=Methylonatrum kenyense TaxID=455253 RepID=UPI0020BDF761|nr:L,D-transpeptidase family protein [Methylonatrum kenyense]MCK8516425.1 L,D-transpeptidase family protein [Methylonatrum kenyense]